MIAKSEISREKCLKSGAKTTLSAKKEAFKLAGSGVSKANHSLGIYADPCAALAQKVRIKHR